MAEIMYLLQVASAGLLGALAAVQMAAMPISGLSASKALLAGVGEDAILNFSIFWQQSVSHICKSISLHTTSIWVSCSSAVRSVLNELLLGLYCLVLCSAEIMYINFIRSCNLHCNSTSDNLMMCSVFHAGIAHADVLGDTVPSATTGEERAGKNLKDLSLPSLQSLRVS